MAISIETLVKQSSTKKFGVRGARKGNPNKCPVCGKFMGSNNGNSEKAGLAKTKSQPENKV